MNSDAVRQEGVLASWDDIHGFGYITPATGGERVFAHIRAWTRDAARPQQADVVTFETELAPDGRTRARAVRRPFEVVKRANTGGEAYFVILGFVGLYLLVGSYWPVTPWVAVAYAVLSLLTVIAYASDKVAARNGLWRTRESTLHLLAMLGGWPGAIVAQQLLHHKNRKLEFQGVFWVTVVINCLGFVLLSGLVTVVLS